MFYDPTRTNQPRLSPTDEIADHEGSTLRELVPVCKSGKWSIATQIPESRRSFQGSKVFCELGATNVTSNTIMAIANLFQVQHFLRKRPGYNELFTTENQPLRRLSLATRSTHCTRHNMRELLVRNFSSLANLV